MMMTNDQWWNDIGSGMPPMLGEDAHDHVQRVIAACWPAARAAIYEAEAAQLTAPMRAEIHRLTEENELLRAALEDRADVASIALRKAWQLGQTYWQQADSEYTSHHKKADVTQAKLQTLVDETRAAILADVTPNG